MLNEQVKETVKKVMAAEAPSIDTNYRDRVTETVLGNQVNELRESADQANVTGAGIATYDTVLINMVRRGTPKLMAFDIAGVQPMTQPSQLIFAIRSRYASQTGGEALFGEPNTAFSGTGIQAGDTSGFAADAFGASDPANGTSTGTGMNTSTAEALGTTSGGSFAEMAFSIEKTNVVAESRALKGEFSRELQYDMKAVHGMSAEQELANILTTEMVSEQDKEMLRRVNIAAVIGAQDAATPGSFDLDADTDGRWFVEKWKAFVFQLEKEANQVSLDTRRGRANRIITSANIASALAMVGILDHNPRFETMLNVDPSSQTYAGMLMGKYPVYIDPYASIDYVTVAYRGANAWDAGIYYCPYVPLEMVRAVGEDSFQPKIGLKTRYGITANPFAANTESGEKAGKGLGQGENPYFRKMRVTGF
jgi:plasmid stability protein